MIQKRNSIVAIVFYFFFFILLAYSSYIGLIWISKDSTLIKSIFVLIFIVFQTLSLYMLSLFARVDGYLFLPKEEAFFISKNNYLSQYGKVFACFGLLLGTAILSIYFEQKEAIWTKLFLMPVILLFYGMVSFFWKTKDFLGEKNKHFIGILIMICCIIIILDNSFSVSNKQVSILLMMLLSVCATFYFIFKELIKMLDKKSVLKMKVLTFFEGLFLVEYLAADQSKKNTENLALLNSILRVGYREESHKYMNNKTKKRIFTFVPEKSNLKNSIFTSKSINDELKYSVHQKTRHYCNGSIKNRFETKGTKSLKKDQNINRLLVAFSSGLDTLFLKTEKNRKSVKHSNFINLKITREFDMFISNAEKKLKDTEYISHLETIKERYKKADKSYSEAIMNARTENIKMRNQNNLLIGIFIFASSPIQIYLTESKFIDNLLLDILIWMIFIRMILRTVEIGTAFYNDITEHGYKNSYLTGSNRITLAIKSVLEISFLAASIYQLITPSIANNEVLKYCLNVPNYFWKNIEYSISVSLFNVSFPEPLIPQSNRNFLWLSTHLIQVISSVLLITVVINSYMGREKKLVYFEAATTKKKQLIIFKKSKDLPEIKEKILWVDLKNLNTRNDIMKKIFDELQNYLRERKISEKDYIHIKNWIKSNDYFLKF